MIEIKRQASSLIVKGHANQNQYGKDIVCAGVSAIVMGALNWFNEKAKIIVNDGYIEINVEDNESEKAYLDLIMIQLKAIEAIYKKYIKIVS
ncbi:ribosomal-processing cysteine protease Prp [Ureaplasma canigenitalium]|uniref:ribosomal-processing cysteine protease Prp n=1 Tax=Ureaplasma canigenitalium TaxID=42092 RepID=UPI0004E19B58|nr:ribosomal-processing cysteine protease Prp [Ureaplasma canigenitalium]